MPSASRRRKAAKKKRAKAANINPSSDGQQGSDDLKFQYERSDVGEVSDFESVGLVKTKEDNVVKIVRELKSQESYDSKHDSIEYVAESAEGSNQGNKSSNAISTDGPPSEYLGKSSDPASAQVTLITETTTKKEINNTVNTEGSVSEEKSSYTESSWLEKSAVAKGGAADLGMKRSDDKVCPLSDENATVSSLEVPKQKEYDSKLPNSSYGSHIPESTNAEENAKDAEIPECSEDQLLVASGPPVRKTSWLNCCGLFEVLGSNR